jgi:NAD(P)-dependent dehydrogenase (short-subunit alcohol dehydrogenase family)
MDASTYSLEGRVAFVTGGGGGIGRAIALCMADMGANIAIYEISPERCAEVTREVTRRGRKVLAIQGDVMNVADLQAAVERAGNHFGRLDILVNNAGGVAYRLFQDLAEKNWRRHIDLNLVSVLAATYAAIPLIIAGGGGGSIINVTSIEGSRAAPGYAVYAACKAGVNNLTRTLAVELSDHSIRVNAIAPDYTETPGLRGNLTGPVDKSKWLKLPEEMIASVRRRTPLGRAGIDMECGSVAAFLASDAASYVTGTIMPVDGGTWASSGWVRDGAGKWILGPEA